MGAGTGTGGVVTNFDKVLGLIESGCGAAGEESRAWTTQKVCDALGVDPEAEWTEPV